MVINHIFSDTNYFFREGRNQHSRSDTDVVLLVCWHCGNAFQKKFLCDVASAECDLLEVGASLIDIIRR